MAVQQDANRVSCQVTVVVVVTGIDVSSTVMIMGEQPFCAHGRSTISGVHVLTMRGAPSLWWNKRCCFRKISQPRSLASRQDTPPTSYEPKLLDNFDHSETSAMIFQYESGDIDTEPSYSCDAELYDEIIGKALSSPLFIQEREEPANLRQAYHSYEGCLLPAQFFFRTHKYGETRIRT